MVLDSTLSCYDGDCSKCTNNFVVCHDGVKDNLRNHFMFQASNNFYNLHMNENDKILLSEILKSKLSETSV